MIRKEEGRELFAYIYNNYAIFIGDGAFSFQEFVEIVYNMGGTAEKTADQEEKELRDAFRVNVYIIN